MTTTTAWRRLATCATIDVLLMATAGTAMASATAASHASAFPALPTLLLLGVGLCGTAWSRRTAH